MNRWLKSTFRPLLFFVIILLLFGFVLGSWGISTARGEEARTQGAPGIVELMAAFEQDKQPPQALGEMSFTSCSGGTAAGYPCNNVDLMAFLPLSSIGGGNGNDIWGWTDSLTGKEYALMGRTSGTSFVDVSDPENPIYLGNLPTHTSNSSWRDIKVYANHAFIVSEASGHGMQVFDLTQLRNVASPPVTFSNTAHYNNFGNAHNIVINEDTGFAYAVGTSTCSGGLHMVNIQNPTSPTNAGCVSNDGYVHDAQCVVYNGPDSAYQGREICFNSNEDTITIVDVTVKSSPVQLSRTGYSGSRYTHQGWLTEDHVHFLLDDELDEQNNGHNTRTYIWDMTDLNAPVLIGNFTATTAAIDHNLYIKGSYAYQSNYRAGLRILDISNIGSASLTEVGYFDVYPANNNPNFNGSWSNYPFFDSGNVIVSGIEQGLFVVRPNLAPPQTPTPGPSATPTNTPLPPTPTNTPGPTSCTVYTSSDVPKPLPNGTSSISSILNVTGSGTINDVNFSVDMSHVWVGDLSMTLTHQDTGTSVNVLNRPGVPASTYGCSGDNIVATLDDEAGSPVENECAGSIPTISGAFIPNNPLSAFDGETSLDTFAATKPSGTWVLLVEDLYPSADAGTLNGWSLEICVDTGGGPTPTNTPPPTATNTPLPTNTPTNTPVPTNTPPPPTATNTPEPGGDDVIYVSSTTNGSVGGVGFTDEDIIAYDTGSGGWNLYFDGSDVGLGSSSGQDVDAFYLMNDGSILLSITAAASISGLGTVDDSDIVRFIPTSLGTTTAGTFEWYFDGSDVGLTTNAEDVDGIGFAPDGRLLISTLGNNSVTGAGSNHDEDLLAFSPIQLGSTTAGSWALYFDGTDVGLTDSSENVTGAWVDPATGAIYLSTAGAFSVPGLSGSQADIFVCSPTSLGSNTACTFSAYFNGTAAGIGGESTDGIFIER